MKWVAIALVWMLSIWIAYNSGWGDGVHDTVNRYAFPKDDEACSFIQMSATKCEDGGKTVLVLGSSQHDGTLFPDEVGFEEL